MKFIILCCLTAILYSCEGKSLEERLDITKKLVESGDSSNAIFELKSILNKDPSLAEARFQLANAYLSNRQYQDAIKELNKAIELGYSQSQATPLLAKALRKTESFIAITKLDTSLIIENDEKLAEVLYYKFVAYTELNKVQNAKDTIYQLKQINNHTFYTTLAEALLNVKNESYRLALIKLESLSESESQHEEVVKLKGQIYLSTNQLKQAAELFSTYIKSNPNDTGAEFIYSSILVAEKRYDDAEPFIDHLLTLYPNNSIINRHKSILSAAKNDYENAKLFAETALRYGSDDIVLRVIAGYCAYRLENYEQANRYLSAIADELPKSHFALRVLASTQLKLGLSTEATQTLMNLEIKKNDSLELFSSAAIKLQQEGKVEESKSILGKASETELGSEKLAKLGLLKLSINDLSGIIDLENSLNETPTKAALQALATAYLDNQEYEKALALSLDWKTKLPDDISPYLVAAESYLKTDKLNDALREYQSGLTIFPQHPSLLLGIANIEVNRGNFTEALSIVKDIIERNSKYIPGLAAYYNMNKSQSNPVESIVDLIVKTYKDDKSNNALRLFTGQVLVKEGRYREALAIMEDLSNIDPNSSPEEWSFKGYILINSGQIELAEKHYQQWQKLSPLNRDAFMGFIMAMDAQEKFKDAANAIEVRTAEKKYDLQLEILKSYFMVMDNRIEETEKLLNTFPKEALDIPLVKGIISRIQASKGKYNEALPNALVAYSSLPNKRNFIFLLFVYDKISNYSAALKLLERYTEANPNDIDIRMLLAERQLFSDPDAAINTYLKLVTDTKPNLVILNNLANIYLSKNDIPSALTYGNQALQLAPKNADVLDTMGTIYMSQNNYNSALQYYEMIPKDIGLSSNVVLNYAETSAKAGEFELAKEIIASIKVRNVDSMKKIAIIEKWIKDHQEKK
ncbi:XrtA/PEP-CTERM system TPR-repeat protein PrsT [Flavobacterium sp. W21_SRS_FM6]|uniref:XrtA/PEP-CTERM system TPR-repeat protein PrsT n=1 Tax=Flavobacterium sp. W21_SRS_FM6 TaxID=3240268 RepID=UPI003F8F0D3D